MKHNIYKNMHILSKVYSTVSPNKLMMANYFNLKETPYLI